MPIHKDIELSLTAAQTIRRQGFGKQNVNTQPSILNKLQELLDTIYRNHLLEPAIIYELFPVISQFNDQLSLKRSNISIHSPYIASQFPSIREIAVAVCTIGTKLEQWVAQLFREDTPLNGLYVDGIGNAALDILSEKVCHLVHDEAASRGYQSSSPLSPGMPGLSISEQVKLFELVSADKIGIKLTPAGVMAPRKSLSMIICIGNEIKQWAKSEMCRRCPLKQSCHYKIEETS